MNDLIILKPRIESSSKLDIILESLNHNKFVSKPFSISYENYISQQNFFFGIPITPIGGYDSYVTIHIAPVKNLINIEEMNKFYDTIIPELIPNNEEKFSWGLLGLILAHKSYLHDKMMDFEVLEIDPNADVSREYKRAIVIDIYPSSHIEKRISNGELSQFHVTESILYEPTHHPNPKRKD